MADPVSGVINFIMSNLVYIIIVVGVVGFIIWLFTSKEKEAKFKPVDLKKEIRKDFDNLFSLSGQNIGFGKNLYIGSVFVGFVLKQIHLNYYKTLANTVKINVLKKKINNKEAEEIIDKNNADLKPTKFLAYRTCGKSFIARLLANLLGVGVKIFLVDKSLIKETETAYIINPYSQPERFLGVHIYSRIGYNVIENMSYKIQAEQKLDAMVNFIPRLTWLEVEQAKGKAKLDAMEEIFAKKRKEQLEQIVKAS